VSTIQPTSRVTGLDVEEQPAISQDDYRFDGTAVDAVIRDVIDGRRTTVLCSHGPVLPQIVESVVRQTGAPADLDLHRAASLATGEFAVLHIPAERPESGVVAIEVHAPAL